MSKFVRCFSHRLVFCDFRPKRNHQLVGFTSKDEQVNLSEKLRKIFMCFVISNLLGVVAAAIQSNVDCEDYISHLIPFKFCRPPGGWLRFLKDRAHLDRRTAGDDSLLSPCDCLSRSAASSTQKPPMCSLVSRYGPSVMSTLPSGCARSDFALRAGVRPPTKILTRQPPSPR